MRLGLFLLCASGYHAYLALLLRRFFAFQHVSHHQDNDHEFNFRVEFCIMSFIIISSVYTKLRSVQMQSDKVSAKVVLWGSMHMFWLVHSTAGSLQLKEYGILRHLFLPRGAVRTESSMAKRGSVRDGSLLSSTNFPSCTSRISQNSTPHTMMCLFDSTVCSTASVDQAIDHSSKLSILHY